MSSVAYVKKLLGVTGGSKKLYRDNGIAMAPIMDDGWVGHFDFRSDYVRNGGGVGVGATFRNLVDGGGVATVLAPFTGLSNRGLLLAGASYFQLPDAFKVAANATHFTVGLAFWNDPAQAYAASSAIYLAGYGYQNGAQCTWAFTGATDANGKISAITFRTMSIGLVWPNAAAINDGNAHFLVAEVIVNSATSLTVNLFVDGVKVATTTAQGGYSGAFSVPAGQIAIVGCPTANASLTGYQAALRGAVCRAWVKQHALDAANIAIATTAANEAAKYGVAGVNRFAA
ncbi:hypothetical protein [Sphingomonas sp. NFR15]|uniref:hypothetical protein n=1 Tax=Sphingomonas sp. NFR15 TaxID=1566282 RepID=UPI0008922BE8|nr:hypothetical protein [Sphingomonas sp. NFR15]SDA21613.1 hypothetical protein SAMN03159340_01469 [Sphingomonas sp. NFR15]